jgi:DnaD/phage-associated family protein
MSEHIEEGYILIARKIRRSAFWKSLKATHRVILLEILLQAQFRDGEVVRNGEILFLKRGQVATSYQQLVDDIGDKEITVKVARNAIEKFIKEGFLTKDEEKAKSKKGLLLTIVNYDLYQRPDNYKRLTENELRMNHDESKNEKLGSEEGKAENSESTDIPTDLTEDESEGGKAEGITRAKQGQSEGKARAINNNVKELKDLQLLQQQERALEFLIGMYEENKFSPLDDEGNILPYLKKEIFTWLTNGSFDEPEEIIQMALEEAMLSKSREWRLVKAILERWKSDQLRTVEDIQRDHEEFKKAQEKKVIPLRKGERNEKHTGASQKRKYDISRW